MVHIFVLSVSLNFRIHYIMMSHLKKQCGLDLAASGLGLVMSLPVL